MAAVDGDDANWRRDQFNGVIHLLQKALQIVDSIGDCPAVGARLQNIIEEVQAEATGNDA
jgi:hypothetical protein